MATRQTRSSGSQPCGITAAALTRAVLPFCLGRGSISMFSRSFNLTLQHPRQHRELAWYQRSRLLAYLPKLKEPIWIPARSSSSKPEAGCWRIRVASTQLETAWNLLYHSGGYGVTEAILEILGIEAIASLWADRGSLKLNRRSTNATGRLNLVRHGFLSAQLIHDWIYTHTAVTGVISRSPHSVDVPIITYDPEATEQLIHSLRHTWHAREESLRGQFRTPGRLINEQWLQRGGVAGVVPTRARPESDGPDPELEAPTLPRMLPIVPIVL